MEITSLQRNQSSQKLSVSQVVVYPDFKSSPYLRHDIALFKVKSLHVSVTPICLDGMGGGVCYVAGWGSVDGSGKFLLLDGH